MTKTTNTFFSDTKKNLNRTLTTNNPQNRLNLEIQRQKNNPVNNHEVSSGNSVRQFQAVSHN